MRIIYSNYAITRISECMGYSFRNTKLVPCFCRYPLVLNCFCPLPECPDETSEPVVDQKKLLCILQSFNFEWEEFSRNIHQTDENEITFLDWKIVITCNGPGKYQQPVSMVNW